MAMPMTDPEQSAISASPATIDSAAISERAVLVESLRWKKFPLLDDGFVCLVDVMGDDVAVVQAARVSYGAGTKKVSDDRTLIRYLLRHRHTTPFEMAEIKLLIRVPMDCWRQWIRHRTASVNEYSTRYSVAIDSAQSTLPQDWRSQAASNRQGSGQPLQPELGAELSVQERKFHSEDRQLYDQRLAAGVAREQARKDLPLATYTEAYWKIDLHNALHFLALRMDAHAQYEIRVYAQTVGEQIIKPLFPMVWEAFEDYRLNALFLTGLDQQVLQRLLLNATAERKLAPFSEADFLNAQHDSWKSLSRSRERDECREKLITLGLLTLSPTETTEP